MEEFEKLLEAERVSVERFVRFRLNSKADADDVLQEVFLAACQKFAQLKNKDFLRHGLLALQEINVMTTFVRKQRSMKSRLMK